MQAFVESLARLARAASGHRAADIALVRDRAAEAEELAADEDRRDHRHIGRVRAAALIGMVDQEGVALGDGVAVIGEHRGAAGRKGADMQRQHDVLGDDVALRVHQRAGGILRLAHDGGKAGAEQRVLHLLHDAGEARLDDFEIDSVDGCGLLHQMNAGTIVPAGYSSIRATGPAVACRHFPPWWRSASRSADRGPIE